MPLSGFKPTCKYCEADSSLIWRKDGASDYICQTCFVHEETKRFPDSNGNLKSKVNVKPHRTLTRYKSARSRVAPKGKGRRGAYKIKNVPKVERGNGGMTTSQYIFHKGHYFQSGDIVSVVDSDDHGTYFAQCNAFMTNEYCEKFLSFTWLLPIRKLLPDSEFDPSLFYLGPSDDIIRDMNCVEFVCHAPSDYLTPQQSIYSIIPPSQGKGYISVNLT